jgi:hypothetical protein
MAVEDEVARNGMAAATLGNYGSVGGKERDNGSRMEDAAYLIYDGECPFCSRYARLTRLCATLGGLQLIDARDGGPLVDEARALGLRLDDGMVLKIGGSHYHGADCVHRLALMSSQSNTFNRMTYKIFKSERLSRVLYPVLRAGRNFVLKILGRKPMGY